MNQDDQSRLEAGDFSQALAPVTPLPVEQAQPQTMTSQQMRVMEVNECLAPAYQKASTLDITDAEIEALMTPFPDSAVEIRPHDGLIYLPHILISDRLNKVFKPGKWALMRRREWMEANTMYAEYVMLIRGCYVGESIGGHPYQPNNPKVNYSDTLESTAAEALRRIAGKRLSCGSQVWSPDYARKWTASYAYQQAGKWYKRTEAAPAVHTPAAPKVAPAPVQAPKQAVPESLDEKKARFLKKCLAAAGGEASYVTELFRETGWILDTEDYTSISPTLLPKTKGEAENIFGEINARAGKADDDEIPMDFPTDKPAVTLEPVTESNSPSIRGYIKHVTEKPTSKGGTRYGILVTDRADQKDGGTWLNTFDDKDGAMAKQLKGSYVQAYFTEGKFGKDLDSHGLKELTDIVP